jgi:tetratricopeptide (TPR) repeat protein
VVAAVLGADVSATVQQLSQELVRQHRLVAVESVRRLGEQRLAGYRFRHILFQQYLYASLDDIERAQLHEAVAQALATLHQPEPEALSAIAGELAWHYREAGILDKAALYHCRAGNYAIQVAAMDVAETHFQEGLTLLARTLAATAHARLELNLRMGLITVQTITQGYGAITVEQALTQAQHLCRLLGDEPALFRVLWHLWQLHFQRGNMRKAQTIATEALAIAQRTQEPTSVLLAHETLGPTLYRLGEMVAAYDHLLAARRLYEAQPAHSVFLFGLDAGLHGRLNEALILWYLGCFDQAQERSAEALAIAEQSQHPYHLASAMIFTAAFYQRAADPEKTATFAHKAIQLSVEHNFALWRSVGTLYHGWAVAAQGELKAGLAEAQQGSDAILATGMKHIRFLAVLADVYRMAGQIEKALVLVDDLLTTVEATEEREWEAELHRLKGALLLQQGKDDQAEDCYRRAIAIAHQQQSKFLALRATVSLCRLWQAQGKTQEAWQQVTTLYHWFTEGFDAPDLRAAQELLEELQSISKMCPAKESNEF